MTGQPGRRGSVSLAPGMHVGEYSVLGLIGTGGMGEVYRARDGRLNRDIAIKLLPPSLLDNPAARARFQREARAVAALNHPNIVTIHEVGEFDDHPFIAFELVNGETLKERITRGPLSVADALAVALPLAEGLRHAHESGVVHRDLKPQNVMVRPDGQVKILDFGLGKFLSAVPVAEDVTTNLPSTATEAGVILGTIGYTAPEHLQGRPVDPRSDQFAFGAILYELLSGRRAFAKETPFQTLSAIIEDEPAPLTSLVPRVPPRVAAIVTRCLRKEPEQRFATTAELVSALRGAGDALKPPTALMGRRGTVAAAVLSAVVVVGVVFVPDWTPLRGGSTQVRAEHRRIAVLPFRNIDGDVASQAFADGLVELLTAKLSGFERQNSGLLVVPGTEIRRDGVTSAQDAKRIYGATDVVHGSLQRVDNRIQLILNLSDTDTLTVRSDVIRGDTTDAQAVQDAAVTALARMLDIRVESVVTRATSGLGAFDYYLQGRGYLQRFERIDSVESAIQLFQQAVDRDQAFALGHAALGEALFRKYELTRERGLVDQARAEVEHAVERDPDDPRVRMTSGIVARGTGDYKKAVAEFKRALAVDNANVDVYRELGLAYEGLEQFAEAEAAYRTGIRIRPTDWSTYGALGRFFYSQGRLSEALAQFQQVLVLTPDNARAYSNVGGIYMLMNNQDEAARAFEKSVSIRATPEALSNLGALQFDRGRFAEAAATFEASLKLGSSNYTVYGNLGSAYHRLPDARRSRDAYQKAIELARAELKVNPHNAEVLADLADFSQAVGRRADAMEFARRALAVAPANANKVMYKVAVFYEAVGDRTQALALLKRAVSAGYPVARIESARSLSELRADPNYPSVIKQ